MEEITKQNAYTRSFRVTEEFVEKLQTLQKELGVTQDKALLMLIKTYELENSRTAIPDRETEISNFQSKVTELTEAFLHSLQLNIDVEERVRGEFILKLDTKDKTISRQQTQLETLEQQVEELSTINNDMKKKVDLYESQIQKLSENEKQIQESLKDKEKLNQILSKSVSEAEYKINNYDKLKLQLEKTAESYSLVQQKINEMEKDHSRAIDKLQIQTEQKLRITISEHEKQMSILQQQAKEQQSNMELKYNKELSNQEVKFEKESSAKERKWNLQFSQLEKEKNKEIKELYNRISLLQDEKNQLLIEINELKHENKE